MSAGFDVGLIQMQRKAIPTGSRPLHPYWQAAGRPNVQLYPSNWTPRPRPIAAEVAGFWHPSIYILVSTPVLQDPQASAYQYFVLNEVMRTYRIYEALCTTDSGHSPRTAAPCMYHVDTRGA